MMNLLIKILTFGLVVRLKTMRIETDYILLIFFIIGLIIILALSKTNIANKLFKILFTFAVAITMPSFIPGHGEIIMLIPSGAMYAVATGEMMFLAVIFTVINYLLAWFILYRALGLFKEKQ